MNTYTYKLLNIAKLKFSPTYAQSRVRLQKDETSMASNELASILARRRAKAGGESEAPIPLVEQSTSPAMASTPMATKSSIAERIALLKQQNEAADVAAPAPAVPQSNILTPESTKLSQSTGSSVLDIGNEKAAAKAMDTSAITASKEETGTGKTLSKIQQLQGSLGIGMNSFGRPKGPSSGNRSGQRESIMSTGEEHYGHTQHAMGVAMPGLTGSAIPMPGLVKSNFRLPGTAGGDLQSTETSANLDNSHATMNRVAGPKRRGPMRPPPGAFRLPTTAAPSLDNSEPAQSLVNESAEVTAPSRDEGFELKASKAPVQVSPPPAPDSLYANPASKIQHNVVSSASASTNATSPAASLRKLPEPEAIPPMKPYQIQDDDPYAPKYDDSSEQNRYAPTGFPSALMANFSMDELTIDKPVSRPAATSTPKNEPTSDILLSRPTPESTRSEPAHTPALVSASNRYPSPSPASEPVPLEVSPHVPVPMAPTASPSPVFVTSTPLTTPAPTPAPESTPKAMAEEKPTSSLALFGGTADDDNSSESDWSDEDNDGENQSLFGAQDEAPKLAAPAPVSSTSSQPKPESHEATSLFGGPASTAAMSASPAHGFVRATPSQPAIPPAPYSSLFGRAASNSSESDSDSDDASNLFGA
ncbi:uncharacterized protein PHALS_09709 [Plasmopara halstedii]|uniref:Uncharacterized protein n=1 Tax=Plasmopara halstedii TaxID=4781 RepID=A0A0P1AEI4_PLAHL|nr:uncharacterized protein PHALS_09709 [Plasmopara halstedii]CEG39464.1 hypothetical protein PHALS_09709 [Plasmopara halstedii]|eukprot:XP_024575833.1 hypothetical protein PHALS_09709 [Plasmopara halstedii]